MSKIRFIGVAGTAGAGKDTVTQLLGELFGLRDLNTGDIVRALTRHVYRLPHDFNPVRDQLYEVANFVRNEIDPAGWVKLAMLEGQAQQLEFGVISGLRSMGEADAIRQAGGLIIGVDASPQIRYERIHLRGRDTEAQKTFEEFLQQDERENRGLSDTGAGRGIRYIIDSADILISNNGSLEDLKTAVQEKIAPALNRQNEPVS